jgi:hypothetical protein
MSDLNGREIIGELSPYFGVLELHGRAYFAQPGERVPPSPFSTAGGTFACAKRTDGLPSPGWRAAAPPPRQCRKSPDNFLFYFAFRIDGRL